MFKPKAPEISTLAALKERHLEALHKFGVTERAIQLLAIISTDWIKGVEIAAAEFRRDHRRDADLLRWLEDRRFIVSEGTSPYAPQFNGFCAALVARKQVAVALFGEMKKIVSRALELLNQNPLRTQVRLDEFFLLFTGSAHTVPALKLLGSASLGIHFQLGSRVQGTATRDSDLDLAILVKGYADPLELWDLSSQLANVLRCEVDLLDFRKASTVMQHQVLMTGRRLWAVHLDAGIYEGYVLSEMNALNDARSGLIDDILKSGRVYGR